MMIATEGGEAERGLLAANSIERRSVEDAAQRTAGE